MTADTQPMSEVEGSSPPEIRSAPSAPGDVLTEFSNWLRFVVSEGGSDLHVKVGSPPMIRYDGRLERLDREALSGAETAAISDAILPPDRKQSFLDRVWNVGQIALSSSAEHEEEILIKDIPNPEKVRQIIDLYRQL